jgi:hypothetical protein
MKHLDISFERKYIECVPEDIQIWFDLCKEEQNYCFKILNGSIYILITIGEKTSGGYQVNIKKIEKVDSSYNVSYSIILPKEEQANITSFVYPYDLVVIAQNSINETEEDILTEDLFKFSLVE